MVLKLLFDSTFIELLPLGVTKKSENIFIISCVTKARSFLSNVTKMKRKDRNLPSHTETVSQSAMRYRELNEAEWK